MVAKKVLAGLGLDKVLLAGSGTAPIPPEVLVWYRRLGLNLLEAYGMTEDFACSHASRVTADGFFRTGDLGEHSANGLLKISGRKKELFKTAKGKYIAPAPIENRLNAHPMVELSMVAGAGQSAAFAIVVPAEHLRPRLGIKESRDLLEAELERLLHDINVYLTKHERLERLVLAREP